MKHFFSESELIINPDGSIYHLHLRPENLAEKVILVGDPKRVNAVASYFHQIEFETENREFRSVTGLYKNKRITVLSTGIGCDNIDIVVNELDALANINFETRNENPQHHSLEIVRIGTCGGMQPFTSIGTFILSEKSIGFDGLLNFYANRDSVCDLDAEKAFKKHVNWHPSMGNPYIVSSDIELSNRIIGCENDIIRGITVACGGFYGPQGRKLRIPLAVPHLNKKLTTFNYKNLYITNFEMESSALAGLSLLLNHKATTICMVVANRLTQKANTNYTNSLEKLIQLVLEKL